MPPPRNVDDRLDELARRCRAAGMTVTSQRVAIFRELVEADDHPSPEMLYERVRRRDKHGPLVSLATVYKTLDTLKSLGLADEVSPVGDTKRYDGNHLRHHHLVCTGCKKVIDFYSKRLDALAPPRDLAGFIPESLTIQIKGLCAACQSTRK